MATPEQILMASMAPMQQTVRDYGNFQVALASQQAQRDMALADQNQRHQQALAILGLQHQNALARDTQQDQAMTDRGMSLLGERDLLQSVGDAEKRNVDRGSLYETAAAYGFQIDPKATPEENERKASQILEGKAVESYKNLISERTKIKTEIDELLTPKTVSDEEITKALLTDPIVSRVLDKKRMASLQSGQQSLSDVAAKLDQDDREALLSQVEVVRTKLEEKINVEQQRKAMVKGRELSNRHDELSTAIAAAQKSIPAHRLGEVFIGGKADKDKGGDDKKGGGGKEGFLEELKKLGLLSRGSAGASAAAVAPQREITPEMLLGGPTMVGGQLVAPLRPPSPLSAPRRDFSRQPLDEMERARISSLLGMPMMDLPPMAPPVHPLLSLPPELALPVR